MVVLGGRTETHDFSNHLLLYQLRCNAWVLPPHTGEGPGRRWAPQDGEGTLKPCGWDCTPSTGGKWGWGTLQGDWSL